ncbi:MAG: cytochrome P450 [Anaerolineae bacterium]|nr:cytochrome P450 [Anaerolineae bacterium]
MALHPPAPKGHFLAGSMPEFTADTLAFMLDMRRYGDIASFMFGPFRAYVVSSPEYVHQVLVTDADKFYKAAGTKRATKLVIGNGLFTNDGDFWKRQRRLVQPAFHTRRIGAYARVMVDHAETLMARWQDGQTYDMSTEMPRLTMGIVSKTLFDADVSDDADNIAGNVTTALHIVNMRLNRLIGVPDWVPTAENRSLKQAVRVLDDTIQRFIDDRRKSGEDKGDLLSMLLLARDEDDGGMMTDRQVRDEAMTVFGAGHETTASALMWTWYLLSQHPEIEARLLDELDTVLGDRPAALEDLPRLTYTEMIVKEAMRLYPPAWTLTRQTIGDVTIGGYPIGKGKVVVVNIYGMHHDARFFPDPDRFDPERFSPENEKLIPKYAYIPFGGGPRVCIGNAFAMMEAKLIVATIARRFHLALAADQQVKPERVFTLRSKYGMRMIATERVREPAPA